MAKKLRKIHPGLGVGGHFRSVMRSEGISVQDIARMTGVNNATIFRYFKRSPFQVTEGLLKVGAYLGFTEGQVRRMVQLDRTKGERFRSGGGRFYQLLNELTELYEKKQ